MASPVDPEELRKVAVKVSSEAAALLRDIACDEKYLDRVSGETIKADIVSEEYIVSMLRAELGGRIAVISEERGLDGEPRDLVALVDPLDGSSNYASCIPWASVSLAFAARVGDGWSVVAGSVAPIFWGHPLSFEKGGGCYEGSRRVEPRKPPKAVAVYVDKPGVASIIEALVKELGEGVKVRSLGSAALEISYVALGRIAGFIDLRGRLRNVDVAAAAGIAAECGCFVLGEGGSGLRLAVEGGVKRLGTVVVARDRRVVEALRRTVWKGV